MRLQVLIFEVDLGGKNKEKILGFELATFGITVQFSTTWAATTTAKLFFL